MSLINTAYYTDIHHLLQRLHHTDGLHIFLELVISSHERDIHASVLPLWTSPEWNHPESTGTDSWCIVGIDGLVNS